jgi:hypothetical protein
VSNTDDYPMKSDLQLPTNDSSKPRVRRNPEYSITAKGLLEQDNRRAPAVSVHPERINDRVWSVDTKPGTPKS